MAERTTAVQLQHGGCAVFEAHIFRTEYGEDRGRVRGADDRAYEHAVQKAEFQDKITEETCEGGGDHNSQSGEEHRFDGNRSGLIPVGAETAVEHNEDQCCGADIFRQRIIVERDFYDTVCSESHTEKDKGQQHGYTDLIGNPMQYNTEQNYR